MAKTVELSRKDIRNKIEEKGGEWVEFIDLITQYDVSFNKIMKAISSKSPKESGLRQGYQVDSRCQKVRYTPNSLLNQSELYAYRGGKRLFGTVGEAAKVYGVAKEVIYSINTVASRRAGVKFSLHKHKSYVVCDNPDKLVYN